MEQGGSKFACIRFKHVDQLPVVRVGRGEHEAPCAEGRTGFRRLCGAVILGGLAQRGQGSRHGFLLLRLMRRPFVDTGVCFSRMHRDGRHDGSCVGP